MPRLIASLGFAAGIGDMKSASRGKERFRREIGWRIVEEKP